MKNSPAKKAALTGVFGAEAIVLGFLESLIPPVIPIPGVKLGFSNIVTMFCASALGAKYALGVTLFKALFALITRGVTAFFMSLCGGLLSLAAMLVLFRFAEKKAGYIGIGVICAVLHNAGQLCVALIMLGSSVLSLAPLLLAAGAATGVVTGTVLKFTNPVLLRQTEFINNGTAKRGTVNKE